MKQHRNLSPLAAALVVVSTLAACDPAANTGPTASAPVLDLGANQSQTQAVVTADNLRGWFFYNDEACGPTDCGIQPSIGSFVSGPGSPPHGVGSAEISVTGTQRRNLATYQFGGTPLASITELRYSTYNPSAGNGGAANRAAYLQFNVDFDGSDTWQRRLVYLPRNNGTVTQDAWQEWDAIAGGTARWGLSGGNWPGTATPGATLRTWADIVASYPGVRIRVNDPFLGMRVGEPYTNGYTENIDSFTLGTASGTTTFDFEPYEVARSLDSCKGRGWQTLRRGDGSSFRNQGDCNQYVNTGK